MSKTVTVETGAGGLFFLLFVCGVVWLLKADDATARNCQRLYTQATTQADSATIDLRHIGPYFMEPCVAFKDTTGVER